jgi:hypothetical protein
LGILAWIADSGGLIYLITVAADHWGIDWHGMPSIMKMGGILLLIMAASALLFWFGAVGWAALVAALPIILGFGTVLVVLGIYVFAGGRQ